MYCEGGRSRTGKLADTARPGIGRLALESGAPVVPLAILGSHQVRNWKRLQFPKVTVQYGHAAPVRGRPGDARASSSRRRRTTSSRGCELHDELTRLGHRGALRVARRRSRATIAAA